MTPNKIVQHRSLVQKYRMARHDARSPPDGSFSDLDETISNIEECDNYEVHRAHIPELCGR